MADKLRFLARGIDNYTNDTDGHTLTGGGRTNTWDSQNRLVQCVNGTNTCNFVYGSDGIRRQSTVNGSTTDFVLDNSMFVRERNHTTGANLATYLVGVRGPEYRRDDATGQIRWYLYDGLGSVLGEADPNGNITSSRKYDAYGLVRGGNNPGGTSSHKFVGQLGHPSEDNTVLIYMRARYYDPSVGRFISEDLSGHGVNWYIYGSDNPVNARDANGKWDQKNWDWWTNFYQGAGLSLMQLGVGICVLAGAAWYVANGGSPAGKWASAVDAFLFKVGAALVIAGALFCALSNFMSGMNADDYERDKDIIQAYISNAIEVLRNAGGPIVPILPDFS